MQIDLNKFLTGDKISFNENIIFDKEDLKKAEILDIPKCDIVGELFKLDDSLYKINMKIKGTMILECARSLEETPYNFDINVDKTFDLSENNEENIKINANILDIFPIIWENIVLEKPFRIVKENNKGLTSGNGWSLTDEIKRENTSQLSELDKLLKMEEEK